jgi:hypothetical protein
MSARVSTFGASVVFEDPGRRRFGFSLPSPTIGNTCQGCGREMPLEDEKVFVPGRGSFHIHCAPPE